MAYKISCSNCGRGVDASATHCACNYRFADNDRGERLVLPEPNADPLRQAKTRRSFPTGESVMKLLYPALYRISKKWAMPIRDCRPAMSRFTLRFGERLEP